MAAAFGRGVCSRCHIFQRSLLRISSGSSSVVVSQQTADKHYDLKWRHLRAKKIPRPFEDLKLPDYNKIEKESKMSVEEMRAQLKRDGMAAPRSHTERNITIGSTSTIFEAYVPPEGDGVASLISGKGAKQRVTGLEKKGKSYLQLRKIRNFDEKFNVKEFASLALDKYVEAMTCLEDYKNKEDELHDLVSEKAYGDMTHNLDRQTLRWKYHEALEPPRVVHIRTTEMLNKENLYGQVTVRLHTKQSLAVYDRFGRLMYGGEHLVKDVLEYVVFEKHLADTYSRWRIHGKVIPDWMPARQPMLKTSRKPVFETVEDDDDDDDEEEEEEGEKKESKEKGEDRMGKGVSGLATA